MRRKEPQCWQCDKLPCECVVVIDDDPKPAPPKVPAPDEVWLTVDPQSGAALPGWHSTEARAWLPGYAAIRYVRAREGGR